MAALTFDPFREQARCARRNRFERWRRERGQAAFHLGALLALALLIGIPFWQNRGGWGDSLAALLRQWPMPVLLLAALAMTWRQAATLSALRAQAAGDWLAALPVPSTLRRRRVRDAMLREAAWHVAIGLVVLLAAGAAPPLFVVFAAAVVGAMAVAMPASRIALHRRRAREQQGSVIADRGAGRLWRWQRIACGVALRGRTLSLGALALLAAPMDSGIGVTLVLLTAGLTFALLSGAWRRSLRVLPQAQAWLATQPLTPWRLLRGACAVPATVLSVAIAAICGVFLALGTPWLAAVAALGVFGLGSLQFAVAAAERASPGRAPLVYLVHAVLLLGVVQSFPIAALPLWMVQMVVLLKRALR